MKQQPPSEVMSPQAARHEYSEAAVSFRHYRALRFAIFSIYIAVIAAVGGVALGVLGNTTSNAAVVQRLAAVAALLVTVVFFIFEIACFRNRQYFASVMRHLEELLGYTSMTGFQRDTVLLPAAGMWALFIISAMFWWCLICRGGISGL